MKTSTKIFIILFVFIVIFLIIGYYEYRRESKKEKEIKEGDTLTLKKPTPVYEMKSVSGFTGGFVNVFAETGQTLPTGTKIKIKSIEEDKLNPANYYLQFKDNLFIADPMNTNKKGNKVATSGVSAEQIAKDIL